MKKVWNTLFARINRGMCEYIISTRVYVNIKNLRNWIKRDICNVIKMIIDKGFLWARKIYVEGRKKNSVSFQSKIRSRLEWKRK